MEEILALSELLLAVLSFLLIIFFCYIVERGVSLKEIEDVIRTVRISYEDGHISMEEALSFYKEIEDIIGRDWLVRLIRWLGRIKK